MKKFLLPAVLFFALIARSEILVDDIRIEGLQRVSLGSVLDTVPVTIGDRIDETDYKRIIRTLFTTGQFDDIQLRSEGNILYIKVLERPTISSIKIDGNSAIPTEDLLDALGSERISEGSVLKRATLDLITRGLQAQYSTQGRYGASVEVNQKDRPRNRVEVSIDIDEGTSTAISSIEIIGNSVYEDSDLKRIFELSEGSILSLFTNDNKYTKEKLQTDLENLESFYKDRGYLQFAIDSSQVSISEDLEELFITLVVNEGDRYTLSKVSISGELPFEKDFLEGFINIPEDSFYSESLITQYEDFFANILGNEGYTFAEVEGVPTIDEVNKSADITFVFNPGRKNYTRRIIFQGNDFTTDEVLRREMRQFEGAPASNQMIEQSKLLLERTGFFKSVNVETVPVAGEEDQVDVIFDVEEQNYGNIVGGFGYSQFGFSFNFNIQQQNFLGSGNTVGIGTQISDYSKNIFLQYENPYYTIDGVSRGYNINYREFDYSSFGITDYNTSSYSAAVTFGFPISEIQRLGFNVAFEHTELRSNQLSSREILDFLEAEGEANKPEQLSKVLNVYDSISKEVDASIADLIVLGGNVGIEKASGMDVSFTPGRGDASQEQTDPDSFEYLEPLSDAFRNYHRSGLSVSAEEMMLDKAQLLGLTAPEMTVLLGGMRSLGITSSNYGLLSDNPEELSNDYFKTLLDMRVQWKPNGTGNSYEALDRVTGEKKRTASRADLVFGSNSQLRALVEVYATDDNKEKFTKDFISAWNKVMNLDRFDIS